VILQRQLDADAAAAKLTAAVQAVPMGLVAHINGQANAAKTGISVPADQILEVFRPDFAIRVWRRTSPPASTFRCASISTRRTARPRWPSAPP
jgi:hypothetical protein